MEEDLDFDHFMGLALGEAHAAARCDEVPVGAVVVTGDGEIVGAAHNLRESLRDPLAHAEILAIRAASQALGRWRLFDCTLFVTLEPCPMCAGAIVNARLPRLVFGAPDLRAGAAGTVFNLVDHEKLNHRSSTVAGIREEECVHLLQAFFAARRALPRN